MSLPDRAPDRVGAAVSIGVVTDEAGLLALYGDWTALWSAVPSATPFQHPDWLLAWWRQFGTAAPRVAYARQDDRLVGLLPLYVLDEPPARKLLPIGAGLTDYQDALCRPGVQPGPLLAAALAASDGVTACDLICLPPDAALRDAASPPGYHATLHESDPCPVLDLAAPIPARQRRKLRMNQHRAARIGGWTTACATPETLDALWPHLARLHQARWIAAGQPGVLSDPRVPAFLLDAARSLLPAGRVILRVLHLQGQVAAACLALRAADRVLFYLSGYDAAFANESPGTLLLGDMLADAAGDGCREAHFLRGNEGYKYAWGARDRMNATLHITPSATR